MSYFYLRPAEGNVQLHIIEECVYQRFDHLKKQSSGHPTIFCEYVLEGSLLDNIGHFFLGFLARLSDHKPLLDFVNRAEEILFTKRIDSASFNDVRLLCKTILKGIQQTDSRLIALTNLCRNLIIKPVAEHTLQTNHSIHCDHYKIYINFNYCLPLVAKRKVEIKKGLACIPCGLWKQYFITLYKEHLHSKFTSFNNNSLKVDPRWREMMIKLINDSRFGNNRTKNISIKYNEIDKELIYFPLCMKNLHNILRTKHRLSHNERFRYSLFLKDIGLSLQDSIYFWQKEYSKPCDGKVSCSHSWLKDEKKYVYSLRHLYGLEGARKNYTMVKCATIQAKPSSEGGCAFKHFDNEYLKNIIDHNVLNKGDWDAIILERISNSCTNACTMYKKAILSHYSKNSEDVRTFSPVEYYLDLKKRQA
ncbi:uncharacterized protein LOC143919218 [Arctopsyche grandis]|uniref:uncharacterized protein LOC143919218 n=1 Tax=Arctopsyche grandis TaxID=121162 RepID=UPI00406DA1C1